MSPFESHEGGAEANVGGPEVELFKNADVSVKDEYKDRVQDATWYQGGTFGVRFDSQSAADGEVSEGSLKYEKKSTVTATKYEVSVYTNGSWESIGFVEKDSLRARNDASREKEVVRDKYYDSDFEASLDDSNKVPSKLLDLVNNALKGEIMSGKATTEVKTAIENGVWFRKEEGKMNFFNTESGMSYGTMKDGDVKVALVPYDRDEMFLTFSVAKNGDWEEKFSVDMRVK